MLAFITPPGLVNRAWSSAAPLTGIRAPDKIEGMGGGVTCVPGCTSAASGLLMPEINGVI